MTAAPITPPKGFPPPAKKPTGPPQPTVITRIPYPKWWNMEQTASIALSGAGTQTPIKVRPGYTIYIATIVISVSKETEISFTFGIFGQTGSMHFGGTDEPKGMVIAMGNSPAPCGPGPFSVSSTAGDSVVGGFVVYYQEKAIVTLKPPVKI